VSVADWALLASVVFAGLWSGLLAMLTLILHPMLAGMDGSGFARFMRSPRAQIDNSHERERLEAAFVARRSEPHRGFAGLSEKSSGCLFWCLWTLVDTLGLAQFWYDAGGVSAARNRLYLSAKEEVSWRPRQGSNLRPTA